MATVQTNDKLHDRVQVTTRNFMSRERTRLEQQFLRNLPDYGDSIYHKLVGQDHIDWVNQAPANMLDMASKMTLSTLGSYTIGLELPLEHKVACPVRATQFPGGVLESGFRNISAKLNETFPAWEPYLEAAHALSTKRDKLLTDIRKLDHFVLKLFREHKSLGPCLRMWPPLWDLLDNDDRRRQGAKPYGAAIPIPQYITNEFPVNEMTAMVVRIKMAAR